MKQKGEKPMFNTIQCDIYTHYTLKKINDKKDTRKAI